MGSCLCDWPIHRTVATGTWQLFWFPTPNCLECHGKAWQEKALSSSGTGITRGGKVMSTRLWLGSKPERQPLEMRATQISVKNSQDCPAHTPHHFCCLTNQGHLAAAGVCRSYSLQVKQKEDLQVSSQLSRQLKADQESRDQSTVPGRGGRRGASSHLSKTRVYSYQVADRTE